MNTDKTGQFIQYGFIAAGLYNLVGILVFSAGFTNDLLAQWYPEVFSLTGQIGIVLWGLAYIAAARNHERLPLMSAVFAVEKLLYTVTWIVWLSNNAQTLPELAEESPMTALFFSIYGLGDLVSCVFFAWVCWRSLRMR